MVRSSSRSSASETLALGPELAENEASRDARGQVGLVEVGEQQLADRGVHGGQRGADLDVRGHQVGIAQPDEVQDAVAAEHGQVHRLPGALAELGQPGRGDGDQVQAAQCGRAQGQRAYARPVVAVGQVVQVALGGQRHHHPVDGRHGQARGGSQVADPPGRTLLVEQRQDAQALSQGLDAVLRAFRRLRSIAGDSAVAGGAQAGRSAVDEELAVRRGMDGLPPLMVGSAPQPTGGGVHSRPWTAGQQVGYGIQKATFIIREFQGEG